nr:PD-(D/E)XK nuclease family transposase [Segatella copri]
MPGETNDLRGCIFDIYCVTDDGKHFIVEMQNRWVPFFVNRFIYLSLPFFDKSEEEFETGFEKLIYVLKYMEMDEVFKNLPLAEQKKMLDYLAKLPDVRFLSSEEREKYDESIKAVDDYYSGLYGSYVEGEKKGIAKGIAEGRVEGELSKGLTIARNLLSMGMSWLQIMQATGLTEEELKPLQA